MIENGAYAIEICHDSMNVAVSAEITKSGEKNILYHWAMTVVL